MAATSPRIAIVGGGVAGLVLHVTLNRRGIRSTLYERETGFSARAHLGGTLDLGWASGQRALRENGLEEAFQQLSRPEGDEFKICDGAGNVLLARSVNEVEKTDPRDIRPEIDRSVLRKLLLDAVPAESVKWGHGLSSVRTLEEGKHELTFANGTKVVCDILVGADGANSRVRPLVSPVTPIYHGITGSEISLAPAVAARPDMKDVVDAVGHGTVYAAQDNKNMVVQRNGDGRIRAYAWFRAPAEWMTPSEPEDARKALLEIFEGWAPWMRKVIKNCDDAAVYHRPLYYLPVGHRWRHVAGVTVIGDAAHLMSPYAGAGANLAMLDGLELGLVLSEAIQGGRGAEERETAVTVWEEKMFNRAETMAAITMENLNLLFSPGLPLEAVEHIRPFLLDPNAKHREA
ncbi:monooxygenase FAD-binding protein [Daedaleopsis nitida]|nr:monooxygenase FAD-binding protein [Daedaleopsis nitida]